MFSNAETIGIFGGVVHEVEKRLNALDVAQSTRREHSHEAETKPLQELPGRDFLEELFKQYVQRTSLVAQAHIN